MRAEPSSSLPRTPKQTAVRPSVKQTKQQAKLPAAKKLANKKLAAKKPGPTKPVAKKSGATGAKKPTKLSRAAEQVRIAQVLDTLDQLYPDAHCELDFHSPFELLIAVILSAQCTDDRVNMITPELFRRYPDPQALARSDQAEVEQLIFSTGFYRNKAKNIRAAAQMIVDKFGGQVPRTLDDLLSLPGVARKTANVVLGTAFGIPSGVVVDTHVMRLSQRLGMTRGSEAVKIEQDLIPLWPQERWIMSAHRLIWHGRRVCNARKPNCPDCALAPLCPSMEIG